MTRADMFNLFLTKWANDQVAKAVEAEQERCARIGDDRAASAKVIVRTAEEIAAGIRLAPAGRGDG